MFVFFSVCLNISVDKRGSRKRFCDLLVDFDNLLVVLILFLVCFLMVFSFFLFGLFMLLKII